MSDSDIRSRSENGNTHSGHSNNRQCGRNSDGGGNNSSLSGVGKCVGNNNNNGETC